MKNMSGTHEVSSNHQHHHQNGHQSDHSNDYHNHFEIEYCNLFLIPSVFTIVVCTMAVVCVCRARKRKSFEILMINLLVQNVAYLVTVLISCHSWPEIVLKVLVAVHILSCFLQTGNLFILTIQRILLVCFPIKANIWITKKRTNLIIVGEYIAMLILVATLTLFSFLNPSVIAESDFAMYILSCVIGGILIILNISVVIKVMTIEELMNTQCTIKRKKRNRKTAMLLTVMCLSYVISHYIPTIGHLIKNDEIIAFIYQYFLWVDALGNALSYILLQTKLLPSIKKILCTCAKGVVSDSDHSDPQTLSRETETNFDQ